MVTVIFNGKNKVDKDSQNSSNIIINEAYEGTKNDSASNIALIKLDKAVKRTSNIKHCCNAFKDFQSIFCFIIIFRDH